MVASCLNHSLYWVSRPGIHDCEICGVPHIEHDTNEDYHAVVVASEPISHEPWRQVPNWHLLVIDPSIQADICRI